MPRLQRCSRSSADCLDMTTKSPSVIVFSDSTRNVFGSFHPVKDIFVKKTNISWSQHECHVLDVAYMATKWPSAIVLSQINWTLFCLLSPHKKEFLNDNNWGDWPKRCFGLTDKDTLTTVQHSATPILCSELNSIRLRHFDPTVMLFFIVKINNFQGDLTGTSPLTKLLPCNQWIEFPSEMISASVFKIIQNVFVDTLLR